MMGFSLKLFGHCWLYLPFSVWTLSVYEMIRCLRIPCFANFWPTRAIILPVFCSSFLLRTPLCMLFNQSLSHVFSFRPFEKLCMLYHFLVCGLQFCTREEGLNAIKLGQHLEEERRKKGNKRRLTEGARCLRDRLMALRDELKSDIAEQERREGGASHASLEVGIGFAPLLLAELEHQAPVVLSRYRPAMWCRLDHIGNSSLK